MSAAAVAHPLSLSLNGVDNVGKTAQLSWLARAIDGAHHVGSADKWHRRWADLAGEGFAQWWFEDSSTAEHTALMFSSHVARREASGPLALEDRGLPMILAACAATSAVKDGLTPQDALDEVTHITRELPQPAHRHEIHLLLRRHSDPTQEAAMSLQREAQSVGDRYRAYQEALAQVLAIQVEQGAYDMVVDQRDAPILDVQRAIRARIADIGVAVESLPDPQLDRIWVLGGMSESGKSTVGELLRDEHGVARLKIGYLLEVAALRAGENDPYAWSEAEQAGRLTEEILRFATATKARAISLESAHRFGQTASLRKTWGPRCQVVYVDAAPETRADRATESRAELRERDAIKTNRGAGRILDVADHVLDNSGPLSNLKLAVDSMVREMHTARVTPPSWRPRSDEEWLQKAAHLLTDDAVALVMATGSTGTRHWVDGWSDVDLLVVRNELSAEWLHQATTLLTRPGIKVALSAFTVTDLATHRVPPRVIHSLRGARTGAGVLYRRTDYAIPLPTYRDDDAASRGELGLVLMNTRRVLAADGLDTRALHKHLVILGRVLLRADGIDALTPTQVFDALTETHTRLRCTPPSLDEVVADPNGTEVQARLVHAAENLLRYVDSIGRTTP
ncbi:hypothetical protein ACH47X_08145 [Promicromonospora kroppenstedtii]|uniref:Nucleotidyltransferase domain-containing protein n=1 Tax=Promicromonospora kroppenstedtii TaxID=440482 RepID=A0ABW7XH74_9MICO